MQLFDKNQLDENPSLLDSKWKYEAFNAFSEKLSSRRNLFPCIPATIGFKQSHFRFCFVSDPRLNKTAEELADCLRDFGEQARSFGPYTSLIVFFETPRDLTEQYQVEDYRLLFWSLLSKVHQLDQAEWPEGIPYDPEHPVWEYCFGGEKYFMYCGTPAHQQRKTRSFPYFIFAITPRWVLEEFHSHQGRATNMKKRIRERILKYDEISIHPDLNAYGNQDNFEWKQYFLSDDDSTPSRCPFAFLHKSDKAK
jgi:FPC/CPF motif-containing protein YcgG